MLPDVSETSKLQVTLLPFNTAFVTLIDNESVSPSQTVSVVAVNDASGAGLTVKI